MTIKWHKLYLDEMEIFLESYRIRNDASFKEMARKNKERLIEMFEEQQQENARFREALEKIQMSNITDALEYAEMAIETANQALKE